jgi:hypothetical protein
VRREGDTRQTLLLTGCCFEQLGIKSHRRKVLKMQLNRVQCKMQIMTLGTRDVMY